MKNAGVSFSEKIRNQAKQAKLNPDFMRNRYVNERILARFALSKWVDHFCVKGGMLVPLWNDGDIFRPTADIDFNGIDEGTSDDVEKMLHDIADMKPVSQGGTLPYDDGIEIIKDSIKPVYSKHEEEGGKFGAEVMLGKSRIPLRVDVGFGNPVIPALQESEYPCLFENDKKTPLPRPKFKHYPPETTLAEKLHATTQFGLFNSRIRDYYDMYVLLSRDDIETEVLAEAIERSFEKFGREVEWPLEALSDEFVSMNAGKWKKWNADTSLRDDVPEFSDVVSFIRDKFEPAVLLAIGEGPAPKM